MYSLLHLLTWLSGSFTPAPYSTKQTTPSHPSNRKGRPRRHSSLEHSSTGKHVHGDARPRRRTSTETHVHGDARPRRHSSPRTLVPKNTRPHPQSHTKNSVFSVTPFIILETSQIIMILIYLNIFYQGPHQHPHR